MRTARCMTPQRFRSREEGTVLLLVVIIVSLVWIIVADAGLVARVELEATDNADNSVHIQDALRSGFEYATAYLRDDLTTGDIDTLDDEWANPDGLQFTLDPTEFGAGSYVEIAGEEGHGTRADERIPNVRVIIEDEDRKWPLNILTQGVEAQQKRRLEGLVSVIDGFREDTALDVDRGQAQDYAKLIHDFLKRPENNASGFGPTPRPLTKTGSILRVTDLALIPGIPPSLIFDQVDERNDRIAKGLMHFVTPWTDLAINVNTSPKAVLRGLFRGRDASLGDDIFNFREKSYAAAQDAHGQGRDPSNSSSARGSQPEGTGSGNGSSGSSSEGDEAGGGPFQEVDDVQQNVKTVTTTIFNEVRTMMTVKSRTFSIWVEVRLGTKGPKHVRRYVVRRDGAKILIILVEDVAYPWYREPSEADSSDEEDELGR